MEIPAVSWGQFMTDFRWKQGEHVAIIAPTGAGKTTLIRQLQPFRKYNLVFGTKPDDDAYHLMMKHGYRRVESVRDIRPGEEKILLWPKQRKTIPESMAAQRAAFEEAMNVVVRQKAWTLWVDEAKYVSENLKLKAHLTYCLEQLRSINATIICAAQRPSFIPTSTLPSSTHVFFWRTPNEDDAKRLSDVGGVDTRLIRQVAVTLDDHEFIYIRSRGTTAKVVRTQVEES